MRKLVKEVYGYTLRYTHGMQKTFKTSSVSSVDERKNKNNLIVNLDSM